MTELDNYQPSWLSQYEEFVEGGITKFKRVGDGSRYVSIIPFLFTTAIITGHVDNENSYEDRWCYENLPKALEAFERWDGVGEPEGWHRHPLTGRRRPEGDPAKEHINP